ncbi:hypothetical protein EVAR_58908_1 [Eumeta japonica]|uniref:Uncharacterized protein n=1 Tax=Eumeta variegata TaxID=151549 RepID=A0A4C1YAD5_EUMVA|nr:hypothetical protein EVAR_58908_1 [Eumeta japonica]
MSRGSWNGSSTRVDSKIFLKKKIRARYLFLAGHPLPASRVQKNFSYTKCACILTLAQKKGTDSGNRKGLSGGEKNGNAE